MRRKNFLVFSLLLALAYCEQRKCGRTNLDITETHVASGGGGRAGIKDHPWTVAIVRPEGDSLTIHCTGSLINREYVLTAAHCFHDKTGIDLDENIVREFTLYFGTDDWSTYDLNSFAAFFSPTKTREIEEALVHPSYEYPKHYYDVALIKLHEKLDYSSHIQPVCLPEVPLDNLDKREGESVTLSGFGRTNCDADQSKQSTEETEDSFSENITIKPMEEQTKLTLEIFSDQSCDDFVTGLDNTNWLPDGFSSNLKCSEERSVVANTKLDTVKLEIFSYQYCNDFVDELGSATRRLPDGFVSNIMCAGSELVGHSSCPGDSGGPLVKNRLDSAGIRYQEQLGVVGGAFKENRKYGFYARLEDAQVLNWIYDVAFDRHVNSNTMLIISDEKMTSEIYDLDESACNKRGPSFPIQSNSTGSLSPGAVGFGGIIKDKPMVCGFTEEPYPSSEEQLETIQCRFFECGSWKKGPELSASRAKAKAIVLNDKLWVTGGYNVDFVDPEKDVAWLKSTELVSLDKSEPYIDLPVGLVRHCLAQVNSRQIILTGGYGGEEGSKAFTGYGADGDFGWSKSTYLFNIQDKTWTNVGDLRVERDDHGCAAFLFDSTSVVVVAGGDSKRAVGTTVEFLRMDELSKGWQMGAKLPWSLDRFSLLASPSETSLLAVGGNSNGASGYTVEHADTVLEMKCSSSLRNCEWKALPEYLSSKRTDTVAMWLPKNLDLCHADTNILVASGRWDSSTEFIDMKENFTSNLYGPDLPVKARGGVGGVIDYTPIMCSMQPSDGDGKECFYNLDGEWKQGPVLNKSRTWTAGTVLNNRLWVTGGYVSSNDNSVKEASTELVSLTESQPFVDLPEPMAFHCMKELNDTAIFVTNFERFYIFDIITEEWSDAFDLPEDMWKDSKYEACGVFELSGLPVIVLASDGINENKVSLLHLDGSGNRWVNGPLIPVGSNIGFPMISTPSKDGVLMIGGIGGPNSKYLDGIWKLSCLETLYNCSWQELPQRMSFGKVTPVAFWLPNSFCPA